MEEVTMASLNSGKSKHTHLQFDSQPNQRRMKSLYHLELTLIMNEAQLQMNHHVSKPRRIWAHYLRYSSTYEVEVVVAVEQQE